MCIANTDNFKTVDLESNVLAMCNNCVVEDIDPSYKSEDTLDTNLFCLKLNEKPPVISTNLNCSQIKELNVIFDKHRDVFSSIPGCTATVEHDIELITNEPIRPKLYPVPLHLKPHFEREVDVLFDMGIIQPSNSPYCSPCVMVAKPDFSYRLTIDYTALNAVTKFDAEPPCYVEESLHKFANAKYLSTLDLSKAYYQIKMKESAMPLTAFPTHRGLMEFTRMPFGLVCAVPSYIRLMRVVLEGLEDTSFYFDNIFVHSKTWSDHINSLEALLARLAAHGLTVKPSKCSFAVNEIDYLGFRVGMNEIKPQESKLSAISELSPPTTKKSLRSLLGLISYYSKFINNYSSLTAPLTDLLKKEVREPLRWGEVESKNLQTIKTILCSKPVLRLPDSALPFVLRTDASNTAVGAILLQYHDGIAHPVAYASRKLLERESNYSTIERECLAIIFGISKFNFYLIASEFLLEVDHRPLVYLQKMKNTNSRLMRWSLLLQPYRFRIVYITGATNFGADLLSRC